MINQFSSLMDRFNAQHTKDISGCWLWSGYIGSRGYGYIKDNYRTKLAHRVSYALHKGHLPDDLCVCHKCDIPHCVNPDHLFLGSHKDNVMDCVAKNRHSRPHGESHSSSRLTTKQVCHIYTSPEQGKVLAARYGVSPTTISEIRTRRKWRRTTEPLAANQRRGNI